MQGREVSPDEVDFVELVPLTPRQASPDPGAGSVGARIGAAWRRHRAVALTVVLPTVLAALYFFVVAADRYVVESEFVVRSPATGANGQLASLVQGTGVVRSAEDAFVAHAYIASRDAVRDLQRELDLEALLTRPEADFLWWYPGLFRSRSAERLWQHLKSFVEVHYDHTTGISTLKVQAFRAEDARLIAERLLTNAERLINRLSERSQADAVRTAAAEVERSRMLARSALERVTEFRRANAVVDPGRVSSSILDTITRLALEAAQSRAQLAELQQLSPDSPQTGSLRIRIAAVDEQIRLERAALAGADQSLAPLLADYERLVLEREFAERTFSSALAALDMARLEAQRQRMFLERIGSPQAPDLPRYPYRLLGTLAVLALCYMVFSIARRLLADMLNHAGR